MKIALKPSRPKDYHLKCKYTEEVIYLTHPGKYLNRECNSWFIMYLYHVNPFWKKACEILKYQLSMADIFMYPNKVQAHCCLANNEPQSNVL